MKKAYTDLHVRYYDLIAQANNGVIDIEKIKETLLQIMEIDKHKDNIIHT